MGDLPDLADLDYAHRVNRAIDHVTRHLSEPLRLDDVARIACFSPHHFHRIFRALVGETLWAFVKRVRLERAVFLMSHHDGSSLTDIASACGFSSSSDFSRSFRTTYGAPPSVFDVDTFRRSRREELVGTLGNRLARLPVGANPDGFVVRLRDLPARRVAYTRVHRPYDGGVPAAYAQMGAWAAEHGLAAGQWLGYQWDDPEIVSPDLCRYDVGVEIPPTALVDRHTSVTEFPAMTVAELDIAGPIDLEMRALEWRRSTRWRTAMTDTTGAGRESWSGLRDRRLGEPGPEEAYEAARLAFELGAAVRKLRLARGWSQAELASAAGMTQSAAARFEAGGTVPTLPVLGRIAKAVDADLTVRVAARPNVA